MIHNNTDIDDFAESAFRMHDLKLIEKYDLPAAEYVREAYGLDPEEYDNPAALRKEMVAVGSEQNADIPASKARQRAEQQGTRDRARRDTLPHVRKAREQLADSPDDDVSKGEQLAEGVLTGKDVRAASGHGLTAAEYIQGVYDIDPEEYLGAESLRRDVSQARRESGTRNLDKEAEQLAARLDEPDPSPSGEATAEQLADSPETGSTGAAKELEVDQRAKALTAMTGAQVGRLAHSDLEPAEFVSEQLGVDPSKHGFSELTDKLQQLGDD
jgi:hypothetical protein